MRLNCVALALTARELAIVELLAERRGRIVMREQLIETLWGDAKPSVLLSAADVQHAFTMLVALVVFGEHLGRDSLMAAALIIGAAKSAVEPLRRRPSYFHAPVRVRPRR